jgi:DNA-binding XRE family transcriptional regulator
MHSLHNVEKDQLFLFTGCYTISFKIPKGTFAIEYPQKPRNLGEKIRKYRIDSGLTIKQLGQIIGVSEYTIINWEKMKKSPSKKNRFAIDQLFSI